MRLCALCREKETGRTLTDKNIPVCDDCFVGGGYNRPERQEALLDDVKAASAKRKEAKAKAEAKAQAKKDKKKSTPKKSK